MVCLNRRKTFQKNTDLATSASALDHAHSNDNPKPESIAPVEFSGSSHFPTKYHDTEAKG